MIWKLHMPIQHACTLCAHTHKRTTHYTCMVYIHTHIKINTNTTTKMTTDSEWKTIQNNGANIFQVPMHIDCVALRQTENAKPSPNNRTGKSIAGCMVGIRLFVTASIVAFASPFAIPVQTKRRSLANKYRQTYRKISALEIWCLMQTRVSAAIFHKLPHTHIPYIRSRHSLYVMSVSCILAFGLQSTFASEYAAELSYGTAPFSSDGGCNVAIVCMHARMRSSAWNVALTYPSASPAACLRGYRQNDDERNTNRLTRRTDKHYKEIAFGLMFIGFIC